MLTKGKLFRFFIFVSSIFLFVACEYDIELAKQNCKNYVGVKECECLENEFSYNRKEMHYQTQTLLQNSIIICYQKVNKK